MCRAERYVWSAVRSIGSAEGEGVVIVRMRRDLQVAGVERGW